MAVKKCECWIETNPGYSHSSGICNGTKERDSCDCGGDELKCDFYPGKRKKALEEKGKLKPCPFCGGKAMMVSEPYTHDRFTVACRNRNEECKAEPCTNWFSTREEAAEVWNRRAEA